LLVAEVDCATTGQTAITQHAIPRRTRYSVRIFVLL
jgi:hypothetical protein